MQLIELHAFLRLCVIVKTCSDMENLFLTRPESIAEKEKPISKLYSMEPEDCYAITQVCEKYHINDSSVWAHVRKYSIPANRNE